MFEAWKVCFILIFERGTCSYLHLAVFFGKKCMFLSYCYSVHLESYFCIFQKKKKMKFHSIASKYFSPSL